jgi:hypothetical protein
VFNVTFNNISVISWRSVLLLGETGVPGKNICWIYNKLCHQCLSPLTLQVRIPIMTWCTRYNIMPLNFISDLW